MALNYKIILPVLFLLLSFQLKAQKLALGILHYANSGKSADLGLDLSFAKDIKKNSYYFGAEMRSIDWGNQLGISVGYGREYFDLKRFKIIAVSSIHPAFVLFYQKNELSFGLSHSIYLSWQSKKRSFLELGIGARYNIYPAYKVYGNYKQFEFPVNLRWGLRLLKPD